jgi:hypothetical protein
MEKWEEGELGRATSLDFTRKGARQRTISTGRNNQTTRQSGNGKPTRGWRIEKYYLGTAGSPELWATV